MALAWSDTKAALDAALSSASNTDRPAVAATAARLATLGARYAAAVTAGALEPVAGSVPAGGAESAARAAQFTSARGALERAVRYLESLPGVDAGTPFRPGDIFPATADVDPVNASAAWRRTAPGAFTVDAPARSGSYVLRVEALLPGVAGGGVVVFVTEHDGGPALAVTYNGRTVEHLRVGNDAPRRVGKLVQVSTSWGIPAELIGGDSPSLAGGSGGARQAAEFRAALAVAAAATVQASPRTDPADRERIALAVARVEAHRVALALPASSAADATGAALELALAAEMDAGARLLSYLAGPA